MARIRSVWPDFFRDPKILALPYEARWLFQGIWSESDDHGRMPCSARLLMGMFFPNDRKATERKVEAWISRMSKDGLLVLYVVDGVRYSFVRNWFKYQKPNRRQPAKYPPPPPDRLFDVDSLTDSVNDSRNDSRSDSVNGAVTHSPRGREGKGKDSTQDQDPDLRPTDQKHGLQSPPAPPVLSDPSPPEPDDPQARRVLHLLLAQGKSRDGALEMIEAVGADELLRRLEAS